MKREPATAADIMQREVHTVRDTWDIQDALRLFEEKRISGAPVVDIHGDLVGVLSVLDIARAHAIRSLRDRERLRALESDWYQGTFPATGLLGGLRPASDRIPVAEVMTPLVIDAPETLPIPRLAALMVDLHIHRVIITREGKLAGIVSASDLLELLRGKGNENGGPCASTSGGDSRAPSR